MVHRDLSPKPGYTAYKALVKARPSGSVQNESWQADDSCLIEWKRPDGQKGFALWTPGISVKRSITVTGKVTEAFDYLGNPITFDAQAKTVELNNKIIYLIGPEKIVLK